MYIVFTTLIITLTISGVYKSKKAPLKKKMHISYGDNSSSEKENMIIKNSDNLVLHPEKHAEDLKNSSFNTSIDKKENDVKKYDIPPFQIQRVKPISERFKQAKIFVTVPSGIEGEKIRLACKNIVEQFPEYSNMVICVYDDSELGLELALGERSFINTKEQKLAWKALYAFNPVEGEYFDDNPNDYLELIKKIWRVKL